jgi:hypothetical protein
MSNPRTIERTIAAILEQCEASSLDDATDRANVASKLAVAMYALVAAEREACAAIADGILHDCEMGHYQTPRVAATDIRDDIRARSEVK